MNAHDFFTLLLPSSGLIITATPNVGGKGWINTTHKSIDKAVAAANELTFQCKNSYFALATYEKEKVWNAEWKNEAGEKVGKYQIRTQSNALYLKSFFLDLDVDATDPKKFPSKTEAVADLHAFTDKIGLPRPMLVDSGGGIHAYWPLEFAVPATLWLPVAEKFKAIIVHENFRADRVVISDRARVLRVLGGYNFRRRAYVQLITPTSGPHTFAEMEMCFDSYISTASVQLVPSKSNGSLAGTNANGVLPDNLGATNDPINFDRVAFHCRQIGAQIAVRGAGIGEKLWRAGLGLAKFAEPQALAYRAISDCHAEYTEAATLEKIANWRTGPTACTHFHTEDAPTCEACPHWQNLTSPAQLGRTEILAPPATVSVIDTDGKEIVIEVPEPPQGYVRSLNNGVRIASENKEGEPTYLTICPYDFYPIKILRQNGDELQVSERSVWRAILPKLDTFDMDINQTMLADSRRLHAHLLSKGIYINPDQSEKMQKYMSAYLQILAAQAERERLYEHLGWTEDHKGFVLGNRVLYADGTSRVHNPSRSIRTTTKDCVQPGGTFEAWRDAMQFYNRPGYEGPRFFQYASLGAPLFHMNGTGDKGVIMSASGESGRGKTTCLKASSSFWGDPSRFLTNGNKEGTTTNMLYEKLGVYCNLPFPLDDTTDISPEVMRNFYLNVAQGLGKERMKMSEHFALSRFWSSIILLSTNVNAINQLVTTGKDVDPHLMRVIDVPFSLIDTSPPAKQLADNFLRQINQNYGHAGPMFMAFVTKHYDAIVRGFIKNVAMIDTMLNSSNASAERFWSAAIAASYTGAQIAKRLGIIDYPVDDDLQWMVNRLVSQRGVIQESSSSPMEVLAEFLEAHVSNTLIVAPKMASNLDNVVLQPHGSLVIRHEMDAEILYVARNVFRKYCADNKASFQKIEETLESSGVLIHRNIQKVLGSETRYAKGQIRCWKIDNAKLGGAAVKPPGCDPAVATNVTPIRKAAS